MTLQTENPLQEIHELNYHTILAQGIQAHKINPILETSADALVDIMLRMRDSYAFRYAPQPDIARAERDYNGSREDLREFLEWRNIALAGPAKEALETHPERLAIGLVRILFAINNGIPVPGAEGLWRPTQNQTSSHSLNPNLGVNN